MSVLDKVFYYEETELPVIKCKDDIWFRGKTTAEILGYRTQFNVRQFAIMLTMKTKENCQNWYPNPNRTKWTP